MSELTSKLLESERPSHISVSDLMSPYWKTISNDDRRQSFTSARLEEARGLVRQNSVRELSNQYRGSSAGSFPASQYLERADSMHYVQEVRAVVQAKTTTVKELTTQYKGSSTVLPEHVFHQKNRLARQLPVTRETLRVMDTPSKHKVMKEWTSAMKQENQKVSIGAATDFLAEYGITEGEVGKESWSEWTEAIHISSLQAEEDVENFNYQAPDFVRSSKIHPNAQPLAETSQFNSRRQLVSEPLTPSSRQLQGTSIGTATSASSESCHQTPSQLLCSSSDSSYSPSDATRNPSEIVTSQLLGPAVHESGFDSPVANIQVNENIWRTVTSQSGGSDSSRISHPCPNSESPMIRKSILTSSPAHSRLHQNIFTPHGNRLTTVPESGPSISSSDSGMSTIITPEVTEFARVVTTPAAFASVPSPSPSVMVTPNMPNWTPTINQATDFSQTTIGDIGSAPTSDVSELTAPMTPSFVSPHVVPGNGKSSSTPVRRYHPNRASRTPGRSPAYVDNKDLIIPEGSVVFSSSNSQPVVSTNTTEPIRSNGRSWWVRAFMCLFLCGAGSQLDSKVDSDSSVKQPTERNETSLPLDANDACLTKSSPTIHNPLTTTHPIPIKQQDLVINPASVDFLVVDDTNQAAESYSKKLFVTEDD